MIFFLDNKVDGSQPIEETSEEEDIFHDFDSTSFASIESQNNISGISYNPNINIDDRRNDLVLLVPITAGISILIVSI